MSVGEFLYNVVFYLFCALTVFSASVVAFSRNILHSAFALLFTFFGVAGLYIFADAEFLAAAQVLIYVGGILVLILFAIMLTYKVTSPEHSSQASNLSSTTLLAGFIAVLVYLVILSVFIPLPAGWVSGAELQYGKVGVKTMGELLVSRYLLPFEVVSVLLLAALLGAAYLARRKE